MFNDDELPYDELDPCCQKEIISNQKNLKINSELRKYDRSNIRIDALQGVLGDVKSAIKCECCSLSTDYTLLRDLKLTFGNSQKILNIEEEESKVEAGECTDSDDDLLLLDELTPFEQSRMQEMLQIQLKREEAKRYMQGIHVEDSVKHVQDSVKARQTIVCHVYDPISQQCANMDIVLEKLAIQYLGTKFRRILMSNALYFLETSDISARNGPLLLCFLDGQLVQESTLSAFGSGYDIFMTDVEKFLNHSHVLFPDLLCIPSFEAKGISNDEEEAEMEAYCDEPGCTRRFSHEHIGVKTPSFMTFSEASTARSPT